MDAGDGDRAYVTCFQDGQIYVVDPRGLRPSRTSSSSVAARTRSSARAAHKKVYVTNFLEDTIAVDRRVADLASA